MRIPGVSLAPLWRVVTLAVFSVMAAEIIACELISPPNCLWSQPGQQSGDDDHSGDGCFCCCSHIVVASRPVFVQTELTRFKPRPESACRILLFSRRLDRPPRPAVQRG